MQRTIVGTIAGLVVLAQAVTFTQAPKPVLATDITAAQIQAVLSAPSASADRLITAVDMGNYNVGVGVLRRTPTKPGAPVGAIMHEHITEVLLHHLGHWHALHRWRSDQRQTDAGRQRDREGRRWSEQSGNLQDARTEAEGRTGRCRDHSAGRLSRLRRCDDRDRLSGGAARSYSRAAGGIRPSSDQEVILMTRKILASVAVALCVAVAAWEREGTVAAQESVAGGQGARGGRGPAPRPPEPPSAMVNPYRITENWPLFGDIRSGAAIGIIPDGKGGTWLHHRSEPPILHIDASGNIIKRFGDKMFVQAHGFCQDRDGNFWAGDSGPFQDNPNTTGAGFRCSSSVPKAKCC